MQKRAYLDYSQFTCNYVGSSKSNVVQDRNTTVKRIVERSANGVINPESLRLNGMDYGDFGLPSGMDQFERMELLRETMGKIEDLKNRLENESTDPQSTDPQSTDPQSTDPQSTE